MGLCDVWGTLVAGSVNLITSAVCNILFLKTLFMTCVVTTLVHKTRDTLDNMKLKEKQEKKNITTTYVIRVGRYLLMGSGVQLG